MAKSQRLPQSPARSRGPKNRQDLRDRVLESFQILRIALQAEKLDEALARVEKEGLGHLEFLQLLIGQQADQRLQRRIERRINNARFGEPKDLETFDFQFNAKSIDRPQIEMLASGQFIRRRENLVIVGQSGLGKSHLIQAIGRKACVLDYRVRYTTSAALLADLTAALADQTLSDRLRYYSRFEFLIIDEFGLDRIERAQCSQASSLLYKVIDARTQIRSTALITNIDFELWGEYLGDAPLATALLDRLVDGAIVLKLEGKSYRAHRTKQPLTKPKNKNE